MGPGNREEFFDEDRQRTDASLIMIVCWLLFSISRFFEFQETDRVSDSNLETLSFSSIEVAKRKKLGEATVTSRSRLDRKRETISLYPKIDNVYPILYDRL